MNSVSGYLTLSAAQKMALALRVRLLQHLDTLSADYYENTPVAAVMYPFKEPVEEISYFGSDLLPAILRISLTTSFTLAAMFALSPPLTLIIAPLIPVFLISKELFRTRIAVEADAVQANRLQWSDFLQEHLSSAISVQLMGQPTRQERRLFLLLARAFRSQQRLYRTGTGFTVCSSIAVALAMSTVIAWGGFRVIAGTLSIGALVAFYGFITQLFEPLNGASDLYARAQRTFASIRQVQSTFALSPTVVNGYDRSFISKGFSLKIDFCDVKFRYARQDELLQIPCLRISPGERVSIIGENGSGKSTFAKLIARFYDADSGVICLNGKNIRSIELKDLHKAVCYLPRDPVLFDGTIASNLRFVRPSASEYELQAVIRCVQLEDLVALLARGFQQRIGPSACQLSGGERQRLALARALLQRPELLILDEATSCVDPLAEALLLENLKRALPGSTLIFISHRFSSCSQFDRVLVVSRGRIVKDGDSSMLPIPLVPITKSPVSEV